MDAQQARERYEQYLTRLYVQRDVESMTDFFAPDAVAHPLPPGIPEGVLGLKLMARVWLESFSDIHFTVHSFLHDQGMVAARITVTGVHTGSFMGIAPTGRRVEISDHPHYRLHQGRVVEIWDQLDMMSLLQQLGALPAIAQAA
jgi:predicted ester cyclase